VEQGRQYRIVALEGLDGAGKSTLLRGLETELSREARVMVGKPSRMSVRAFRELAARRGKPLYQHVIPDPFRTQAYLLEAAVQFQYLDPVYSAHDVVLFDRWYQTWDVYCEPPDEFETWFARLRRALPRPDVTVYVRVDPQLSLERLHARDDPWVALYGAAELRAKMTRLSERYEQVFAQAPPTLTVDGARPAAEVLAAVLPTVREALQPSRPHELRASSSAAGPSS
jgi:thymidylate kinase